MQKLLKRTRLAENHAKHKAKRVEEWTFLKQKREAKEGLKLRSKTWTEIIRSERTQRKENYLMGPLSPWPMIKHYAGTHYGTLDPSLIRPIELPERIQPKRIVFKEGDRVCVVQGDEYVKGQIGKITSTSRTSNTVVIEGVKRLPIRIPKPGLKINRQKVMFLSSPVPIPDVRLVYPIPDPITGIPRDCILEDLKIRNRRFDIYKNEEVFDRWLEPQHIRIPWPEESEENFQDEKDDSLRLEVETTTFLPTLLRPPMPLSVIDELRNRYSAFRSRHDDDYLEQKRAEDEATAMNAKRAARIVPRGARNIARTSRVERDDDGNLVVPVDVVERISDHMQSKSDDK